MRGIEIPNCAYTPATKELNACSGYCIYGAIYAQKYFGPACW